MREESYHQNTLHTMNAGEGVDRGKPSYTVGGDVN